LKPPQTLPEPVKTLDLRGTKCPLNFVQTKLALEKLSVGEILGVMILTDGESAINIPNSILQEGHSVLKQVAQGDGASLLLIEKK
jgi:TusA-related sulfurtransferase